MGNKIPALFCRLTVKGATATVSLDVTICWSLLAALGKGFLSPSEFLRMNEKRPE